MAAPDHAPGIGIEERAFEAGFVVYKVIFSPSLKCNNYLSHRKSDSCPAIKSLYAKMPFDAIKTPRGKRYSCNNCNPYFEWLYIWIRLRSESNSTSKRAIGSKPWAAKKIAQLIG